MKFSDIKVNKKIPEDKKFIEIFEQVILKNFPCYLASIKVEGIKPFSSYKPSASTVRTFNMLNKIRLKQSPKITVYQKDDLFIMSDDYNTYYTYLALKIKIIPCIVIGSEPQGKYVIEKKEIEYSKITFELLEEPTRN